METTQSIGWRRVTKQAPCPICKKPDWCCVGDQYVNCMRLASSMPAKNGGWLWKLDTKADLPLPPKEPDRPTINVMAMMNKWRGETAVLNECILRNNALLLGVTVESLRVLDFVYAREHRAAAFPMSDGYGCYIGIRLRNDTGRKWAVTGSHQGIFLPRVEPQATCYICEGPTDTAAVLSLGLFAIGRPSCRGCEGPVVTALRRLDVRRTVILTDNDDPGFQGARALAASLPVPSVIGVPPAKDIREFVRLGGTAEVLNCLYGSFAWRMPA